MRSIAKLVVSIGIVVGVLVLSVTPAAAATVSGGHDKTFANANGTTLGTVNFDFIVDINSSRIYQDLDLTLNTSPNVKEVRLHPTVYCHRDRNDEMIDWLLADFPTVVLQGSSRTWITPGFEATYSFFGDTAHRAYSCNVVLVKYNVTWVGNSGREYKFTEPFYERF